MDIIYTGLAVASIFLSGYFMGKRDAHNYWASIFKRELEGQRKVRSDDFLHDIGVQAKRN